RTIASGPGLSVSCTIRAGSSASHSASTREAVRRDSGSQARTFRGCYERASSGKGRLEVVSIDAVKLRMSLKPKIEAIIYAAETPVTLDQIIQLVRESAGISDATELRSQVMLAVEEL